MEEKFIKLTNAAYKALEFFPESDPLKNRAKDKALAIMSALMGRDPASGGESFLEAAQRGEPRPIGRDIDILLGYFWIAKMQGWLNSTNYLIISNEYEKLKKEIDLRPPLARHPRESGDPVNDIERGIDSRFHGNDSREQKISKIAAFKDNPRQSRILEFLQQNEKAQVMDLQKILPDVTKRTIRRDLDELLQTGKITRFGEFNQVFYKKKR